MKYGIALLLTLLLNSSGIQAAYATNGMERLGVEICRQLVAQGEILSMTELMERVDELEVGKMLDTSLLRSGDDYIYEMEVVGSDGVVRMIHVDARSGTLVSM